MSLVLFPTPRRAQVLAERRNGVRSLRAGARPLRAVAWAVAFALAAGAGAVLLGAQPAPPQGRPGLGAAPAALRGGPRHTLAVRLDPAAHTLAVEDEVTLPPDHTGPVEFLLSASLRVQRSEPRAVEVDTSAEGAVRFFGINSAGAESLASGRLKRYRVALPAGVTAVRLAYAGRFDFGLSPLEEQYTRGFRETRGIVSPEGVYLAGDGFWYPHLGPQLLAFEMTVAGLPEGWHAVSEGNGTSRGPDGAARWESGGPVDEIHVVGGPLHLFRDSAGAAEALVYLRSQDGTLAGKYLEATAQYLEMYRALIGPYPYGKFALVENFWETGYGMPSFTLLGSEVIRLPFILASSYPHEILHNWWGNSVFVDYESGNWCEGLTAYMADHLIQEQRGRGNEYRRDTLQKYRNYVRGERDFPLAEFRARHSAATEAVGYGKALLGFHMLRRRVGDEAFRRWSARFFRELRGKKASFADVRRTMEAVSGQDLARFFRDWVERPGAATLGVAPDRVVREGEGWVVEGRLRQEQGGEPFLLDVPLAVQTTGPSVVETVHLAGREVPFRIRTAARPLALHVDPEFDTVRRLDPREIPPSIGQVFGEPEVLAVLPSSAPPAEIEGYRRLVEGWRSDSHRIAIRTDAETAELPPDRAAWLLGRTNSLAVSLFPTGTGFRLSADALEIDRERMALAGHSFVLTRRHPGRADGAVGWIVADPVAAMPGLGRKLPHYGKYSYLGFEGQEPTNVLKGQWAATDSPLRVDLRSEGDRVAGLPPLALPARRALAELPPAFSQKALLDHVAWLAAPEREGRGIGTAGLEAAATYIASQLEAVGLKPGGDGGTYFQRFPAERTPDGSPGQVANVIGILPGTGPADETVIVSAHYDHLGRGWPDVHQGDAGKVHPGADDNASGVAVLLELARALAAGEKPRRTIVFIAFTGEEAKLMGSRHYAAHPTAGPLAGVIGVVNLDTVGRLRDGRLSVLASGTATEWPHVFRGIGFVTGIESRLVPESFESSDQRSFIDRGVPAVQLFTEPHADYHRPGDTAEKVDAAGLVKVATVAKEAVAYLAERKEPLHATITRAPADAAAAAATAGAPTATAPAASSGGAAAAPGGRRVSFGVVPDFGFSGPGARASGVVPGSPAEKAGVQAGDVILRIDGRDVSSLQGFSELLRSLSPGQTVEVVVRRGADEKALTATLAAR